MRCKKEEKVAYPHIILNDALSLVCIIIVKEKYGKHFL